MKKIVGLMFLLLSLAAFSSFAAADSLDGHSFTVGHAFPDLGNFDEGSGVFTAPGVQSYAGGIANLGIAGNNVTAEVHCGDGCSWTSGVGFNGWEVILNDAGYHFDSVSLLGFTEAGFDSSRISWNGSHIYIDLQGLDANGNVVLNADVVADAPEPGSLMLLGSGMLGLAGTIRRKLIA